MNHKLTTTLLLMLAGAAGAAKAPNILFIAADDMKPVIGATGDSFAQTPNLDRLAVGFKKPHLPFIAPKKYWDLYERDDIRLAAFQELPLGGDPRAWNGGKETRGYGGVPKNGPLSEDLQRELIHGYYACVSLIDAQVGRLLDKLEELKLADNTIIVFWGDHGFHLGDHGEWGKHTNMEQATRVPLIISSPEFPSIGKNKNPAGFIDIYPTLCDLADVNIPDETQNLARDEKVKPLIKKLAAQLREDGVGCNLLLKTKP